MYLNAFGVAFLNTSSLSGKCLFNLMDYKIVIASYMMCGGTLDEIRIGKIKIRQDSYVCIAFYIHRNSTNDETKTRSSPRYDIFKSPHPGSTTPPAKEHVHPPRDWRA